MLKKVRNIICIEKGMVITQGNLETIIQEERFIAVMPDALKAPEAEETSDDKPTQQIRVSENLSEATKIKERDAKSVVM
jgi:hypothetical protein